MTSAAYTYTHQTDTEILGKAQLLTNITVSSGIW